MSELENVKQQLSILKSEQLFKVTTLDNGEMQFDKVYASAIVLTLEGFIRRYEMVCGVNKIEDAIIRVSKLARRIK